MTQKESPAIAVLGAGSWGTALGVLLARNGANVRLWGHLKEEIEPLQADRENRQYLPGIPLPDNLYPLLDLSEAVTGADEILVVVPSHAFRRVLESIKPLISKDMPLSWATKGLEPRTGEFLHQVAVEVLGERPFAIVSGPTFAKEVAEGLPTAMTVASLSDEHACQMAEYLNSDCFIAYTSNDVAGVQLGGCAKNVLAIAAGISDGLGFGANSRAALITRGLAEIMRLGKALGAKPETFMGLAGLGDLILTCTDNQSRNRRMGLALAKGLSIEQARQEIGQEVEGVGAAQEVYQKASELGVDMPITTQVYRILYQGLDTREAVQALLQKRVKVEAEHLAPEVKS